MTSGNKAVFVFSIILNILFVALFGSLIFKRGLSYLRNQTTSDQNIQSESNEQQSHRPSYYTMKKKQYEGLPNSENEIILLGDSLTDLGEWAELFESSNIVNRGISGDTTTGILKRLNEAVESQPLKIFLLVGINDILFRETPVDDISSNYRKILETIERKSPDTQIFIQSVLPINNEKYQIDVNNEEVVALNFRLQELAAEFDCYYIDLYKIFVNQQNQLAPQYTLDGIHLTGEGYLLWKEALNQYIFG